MNPMNNRPIYETPADVAREDAVAAKLSAKWDIRVVKLKPLYPFDRAFVNVEGDLTALLEIKCRTTPMGQYPDYLLSLDKYQKAITYETAGLPVYLAVQWTDVLGWHKINHKQLDSYSFRLGGRTDRDDAQDVEPCVFIPTWMFTIIK